MGKPTHTHRSNSYNNAPNASYLTQQSIGGMFDGWFRVGPFVLEHQRFAISFQNHVAVVRGPRFEVVRVVVAKREFQSSAVAVDLKKN